MKEEYTWRTRIYIRPPRCTACVSRSSDSDWIVTRKRDARGEMRHEHVSSGTNVGERGDAGKQRTTGENTQCAGRTEPDERARADWQAVSDRRDVSAAGCAGTTSRVVGRCASKARRQHGARMSDRTPTSHGQVGISFEVCQDDPSNTDTWVRSRTQTIGGGVRGDTCRTVCAVEWDETVVGEAEEYGRRAGVVCCTA